jgi:hypothetical protein
VGSSIHALHAHTSGPSLCALRAARAPSPHASHLALSASCVHPRAASSVHPREAVLPAQRCHPNLHIPVPKHRTTTPSLVYGTVLSRLSQHTRSRRACGDERTQGGSSSLTRAPENPSLLAHPNLSFGVALAPPPSFPPLGQKRCLDHMHRHRHKTCFRLPPSSRNSSSSCSTAYPRLSTRAFWATGSTPSSSRCMHHTYITHSVTYTACLYTPSTGMACPPLAYMV